MALPVQDAAVLSGVDPVPAFLQKLWAMVVDSDTDEMICWSEDGKTFVVKDTQRLAETVLPKYFKHRNFSSFVRQLNLYNFLRSSGLGTNAIISNGHVEFGHTNFVRNHPELLPNIKRKIVSIKAGTVPSEPGHVAQPKALESEDFTKSVSASLEKLQAQQEQIMGTLQEINRDNRGLWTEMLSLRQSVQRHEVIIEKLVKFIGRLFKGRSLVAQKRKRFMYEPSDALEGPAKRPTSPTRLTPGPVATNESASDLLEDLLVASKGLGTAMGTASSLDCPISLTTIPDNILPRGDSGSRDVVAYTGTRGLSQFANPASFSLSATGKPGNAPLSAGAATSNLSTGVGGRVDDVVADSPLLAVAPRGASYDYIRSVTEGGMGEPSISLVQSPPTSGFASEQVLDSGGDPLPTLPMTWPGNSDKNATEGVLSAVELGVLNVDHGIDALLQQFTANGVSPDALEDFVNEFQEGNFDSFAGPTAGDRLLLSPGLLEDETQKTDKPS